MNTITAIGKYKGDYTTEKGIRTLIINLPGKGKNPEAPLFVVPTYPSQNSCAPGVFEVDTPLLVIGRLYSGSYSQGDNNMYVFPTQELQQMPTEVELNHVSLAGSNGKPVERGKNLENVVTFGVFCKAPSQKAINYNKMEGDVGFICEAWDESASIIEKWLYPGRGAAIGASLIYQSWVDKNSGESRHRYQMRVKNNQFSFFGKSKPEEKKTKTEVYESPHQQAISKPNPPAVKKQVDDGIPF